MISGEHLPLENKFITLKKICNDTSPNIATAVSPDGVSIKTTAQLCTTCKSPDSGDECSICDSKALPADPQTHNFLQLIKGNNISFLTIWILYLCSAYDCTY